MEAAMRLAGRERLGFYPLPAREAERIRRFLVFPDKPCCALDPCVGDGAAFAEIASDKKVLRYGVELDAGRAEQARSNGIEVIHGNCFDVQCPVESFSLIYLNPPYDFEIGEEKSQRMEKLFLEHVHRWLIRGGILVFVVPAKRITDCAALLSFTSAHWNAIEKQKSISWTACSPRPRRPKTHRWPPSIRTFESSPTCG
jgi:16S rRNA G966 N2-methylase RsmD